MNTASGEAKIHIPSRDPLHPAFPERNVPVFFGCDDKFLPHAMTVIASLLHRASPDNKYDLFIVGTDFSLERVDACLEWMRRFPNASLRFVDLAELIEQVGRKCFKTTRQYSLAVYFRMFAPTVFGNYDKIAYLDSDIVVLDDVAEFYNIDLGDKLVGAAHDFVSEYQSRCSPEVGEFWRTQLGLEPGSDYFMSGGIVLNLAAMREEGIADKLLEKLRTIEGTELPDQDVMNAVLKNRIQFIDLRWNYLDWMLDRNEESKKYELIAPQALEAIRAARESFKVLHYSDKKPWSSQYYGKNDGFYWRYAASTPFYHDTLARLDAECTMPMLLFRLLVTSFQICHFTVHARLRSNRDKYLDRVRNIKLLRQSILKHLGRKVLYGRLRQETVAVPRHARTGSDQPHI